MPFIDDGKTSKRYDKISKKKEAELKKTGYKPYDVRYGISFPRGGKLKVWAKNESDAHSTGANEQAGIMDAAPSWGHPIDVKAWKKPNHPKTRTKRKNNPRYVQKKVKRTHPKTGKKFTQTIYVRSKEWWKYPR